MKQAVIIYGAPGSGKGTQADLLARKFQFIHFDTGKYVESMFFDKEMMKRSDVKREKKNFDTGKLCTPEWILKIISEATTRIAKSGMNIVYSGSPRTFYEAFGDKKHVGLLKLLEGLYGKKNITIIKLDVGSKSSMRRNSARVICSVCGLPRLAHSTSTRCVFCDGHFRKRTLDDPSVIKVRLLEYKNRTFPIIARAKKAGYKIKKVNGEPLPYKVFESVTKTLGF